ncbi:hypothetical protein GmHk_04G011109 [Glycine max]|nr:hypothetical protein GmHk_04G011109 [Glycine max]
MQTKFDIPKAPNAKKKVMSMVATRLSLNQQTWEEFAASCKTPNWKEIKKKAQKFKNTMTTRTYCLVGKLLDEKTMNRQQDAMLNKNTPFCEDPPFPIERHGTFVPYGRDDILNTAIGKSEHPSRVRAVRSGMKISQYYGRAPRGSNSSSTSITQQQLAEIIGSLKEEWRNELEQENKWSIEKMKQELKQAIKIELSQRGLYTKGNNGEIAVNPSREEHVAHVIPTIGFVYASVAYPDDVVRVNVEKVFDGDVQVPFSTSEIKYVRQTLYTFIAWPTNLVKIVSHEDSYITPNKVVEPVQRSNNVVLGDSLHHLIRTMCDIYEKPVELLWDGTKFRIPNVDASFFLTYYDVNEIISGDKCLNIVVLQLWMISSLGHGLVYGFLEPQSIHNANDRHVE